MKVLILNASPRKNGLIATLLTMIQNSLPKHCESEQIYVHGLNIHPCTGCMNCRKKQSCYLPEDDAQRILTKIQSADVLIIGSPCYWGNMNGQLKVLFDRIVYGMMDENKQGFPIPLQKGKKAIIVATSTTIFPFNIWFRQTRGVVNALKEILKWSGYKIIGTIEKGGTKKNKEVTPKEKRRCIHLANKISKLNNQSSL